MASFVRRFYRRHIKYRYRKVDLAFNKLGHKHKCNICGQKFARFLKYGKGTKGLSDFLRNLDLVGSDLDNFGCIYCGSTDRERHLFLFFDALLIWNKFINSRVLHFAAEPKMSERIKELKPQKYIMADLFPVSPEEIRVDITEIPFENNSFDFIICNHVLEHVSNYKKALNEVFRVLKPAGIAVMQTPYSNLLQNNFEEEKISTEYQREFFYGQKDHLRVFGKIELFTDIGNCGFNLSVVESISLFGSFEHYYYGVNAKENLVLLRKLDTI